MWMESRVLSVCATQDSLGSCARLTLMTVLEYHVVEMVNVWMESTHSHVIVHSVSLELCVMKQMSVRT